MQLIRVIYRFFDNISSYFQSMFTHKAKGISQSSEAVSLPDEVTEIGSNEVTETESDKVSLSRRALTTRLYMLEQEIEVFKLDFPNEYNEFLKSIENIRAIYNSNLEEAKKNQMTFEIDPELNSRLIREINELEKSIKKFIECQVKFNILAKRVQILIAKLNVLYNVSISHPNETDKVIAQVDRALNIETEMVQELKESEYILSDIRLKDRLITLFSYIDYEIFKTVLRNSSYMPEITIKKLVLFSKFKDFDYVIAFKAFLEDELSDLAELLPLITDEGYRKTFEKKITSLLNEIACATDVKTQILNKDFWNRIFELESTMLELLRSCNIAEKDRIKVKVITRLNISVDKSDVHTSPKTNAYLALVSIFSTTHDNRIWLLIKFLKSVSDEVTYKEIYFLLLLFDAMDLIQNTSNTLKRYIEKYIKQYSYDSRTIMDKKRYVLNTLAEKQYIKVFSVDEDADNIIATLSKLNLDFEVTADSININSFYFNGLEKMFSNSLAVQLISTQNVTE